MRTWKSVARVGFDSSASESSDSESDGSSDTDTDTDSDTEEEDSGFLNRKPVRAKQKVSKKTTTKSRKAGAPIKMNKKEKNRKGSSTTIAKKQRAGAANKRNNKENKVGFNSRALESSSSEADGTSSECDESSDTDTDIDREEEDSGFLDRKRVRAKHKVGFDSSASESSSSEINDTNSESDGSSDTDTDTDSDTEEEDSGFLDRKPVRAKPKVFRKTTTERRKAGAPIKMNKKEKNGKASCKKVLTEKPATSKRKNGVSTTNTKKQKPEATNKTNQKEKKASLKKVPMEKARANKRKNVTKEGRENEDGPKAKKRREALPKQCPLTSEESEESVNTNSIPPYVLARGLVALAAYKRALEKGKTYDRRIKIVLIGQDRSGKTSLRRYLVGKTFNEQEPSTDGIEMIPSIKNAGTGAWKNPADLKTTSAFHHKFAEVVTEEISSSSKNSAQLFIEERRETQKVTQETSSKLLTHETSAQVVSESIESTQDVKKEQKLEEIPEKVLFLIERGLEGNYTSKNDDIWPIVWDFAGQAVYHAIHPIFLSQEDLYVLVSDLTQELCSPAQCRVRTHNNDEVVVESPHNEDTNLDHMMRWLDLVHSLASRKVTKKSESWRDIFASNAPPASLPPVVLVGTHADGVTNPREKMDFVFKTICDKASLATVKHISQESFFIDNSNPNREDDPQIVSLRKELLDLSKRMPHINNEIPLQWLRVEEKIHQMVTDSQVRYVRKKSFKEDIAEGICQFNSMDDVEELLHFLQARGIIIYQDLRENPDGLVVLDPQWLIRVLSEIITVSPPWKNDPSIQKDYKFLERRGLLSQQLLNRAFQNLKLEDIMDPLIHIMKKFVIICDSKNCNGEEYPYFVPCMLRLQMKNTRGTKVQNGPLPVFLKSDTKYIPSGLFCRLSVLFWDWTSKLYPHCKAPAFYANAARFQVSKDYHLTLKCYRTVIKLAIWTTCDSDRKEEQSLCEKLLSHLEHCRSELNVTCHWLRSVTWELCVKCPLCEPCPDESRVGTGICIWHGQNHCHHDDCGHYLLLRSLDRGASCEYFVDDVPSLSAEKLKPWTQALESFKCKERNVKQGTPSDDELEHLAAKLGGAWKKLGRRLGIKDPKLGEICKSNEALSEKGYQMLRHWKGINGSAATYQILGQALQNNLVNLRNLAEEFCYEKQQLEMCP